MRPGFAITPSITLLEPIGQGGMGRVWSARHDVLDAIVAVKLLNRSVDELDATALIRFQREARATAKLDCRHVVRVFDAGVTADGAPYLVMEHLRGETVAQRVARLGALPLAEVACIVRQAVRALVVAHGAGIHHRDVSAGNLFLTADANGSPLLKVLDFGVAKLVNDETAMTQTGVALGTPRYMSPEQTMGHAVDHRSDLWALAAVVYEALTGAPPFFGATPGAVAVAIARGEVLRPTERVPALPCALDAFMARAFARDLADRFENAVSLGAEFATAAGADAEAAAESADWRRGDEVPASSSAFPRSVGTAEHFGPERVRFEDARGEGTQTSHAAVVRTPSTPSREDGERLRRRRAWFGVAVAAALVIAWVARSSTASTVVRDAAVDSLVTASDSSSNPDEEPLARRLTPAPAIAAATPDSPTPDVPLPLRATTRARAVERSQGGASPLGAYGAASERVEAARPSGTAVPIEHVGERLGDDGITKGPATPTSPSASGAPQVAAAGTSVPTDPPAPSRAKPKKGRAGSVVINGVTDYGF